MAISLTEYLATLHRRAARPGDPAGGFLEGQPDQLQKLPSADQGHGGEFVVNAEATRRFRPILEAINRSVPAAGDVRTERPSEGRAYYAGGETGMTASEADAALGGTTAPDTGPTGAPTPRARRRGRRWG